MHHCSLEVASRDEVRGRRLAVQRSILFYCTSLHIMKIEVIIFVFSSDISLTHPGGRRSALDPALPLAMGCDAYAPLPDAVWQE